MRPVPKTPRLTVHNLGSGPDAIAQDGNTGYHASGPRQFIRSPAAMKLS
jgi:hypothetical protein